MKLLNRTVTCRPVEESTGIIIYKDSENEKCIVVNSDERNIVIPGDTVIIDPRVAIQYDSEENLYYIHELAIKAVIR
jgi:hypothetical protein